MHKLGYPQIPVYLTNLFFVLLGVQQEEFHEKLPGAEPCGQIGRSGMSELVFYTVEARQGRREMWTARRRAETLLPDRQKAHLCSL